MEEADLRVCRIRTELVYGIVLRQTVENRDQCFLDGYKVRALCSESKVVYLHKAPSARAPRTVTAAEKMAAAIPIQR